ncbi:MAG: Gfo/Idh/MocA family oxidoreductase [Verrucomicrobia bacterium]|nr:Gfo/Idh/MocA family oxidoreductase [Verrucomicrobiota bacterium]
MTNPANVSRRHFLHASAATAFAAPLILSGGCATDRRLGANDRLTMGFIGNGKQAGGLLGGFLNRADTQVVAVCDVDTTRREAAKKTVEAYYAKKTPGGTFKGCDAYTDFHAVLARKDIDAVCIATPDHWHAIISVAAAYAGKDIYCEKPLSETVKEARAMVAAVRRNQRVFQTGSMQRSSREFRVACELVRNGVIGKISRVTVGVGGPGKPCDLPEEPMEPGLDWNMWLGPAPMRPYNSILSPRGVHTHFPAWRNYWEYGGGMVTDWGAHHFDIAQWGLGMDASGPVEITPPADVATAQSGVRYRYADGIEVEHISENGVTFFGSGGKIYVNRGKFGMELGGKDAASSLAKDKAGLQQILDGVEKEYLAKAKVKLYASTDHKADFIACIRNRKRPITDVDVGAHTVTVCHLVNFAYRYGKKIQWNPAKHEFINGTGNAKWLDREYRGIWRVA